MSDVAKIAEVLTRLAIDEMRYGATKEMEKTIVMATTRNGYVDVGLRTRLINEKQVLAERIRRDRILLACLSD